MPKRDITAAFNMPGMQIGNRKKTAAEATTALLSGNGLAMDQQPSVPNVEIDLDKIKLRPLNRFHPIENLELDESIRLYGLINPVAVCHHEGEDQYTISAGERRYQAVCRLHKRYPNNPRFQKIECKVYILTEDETLLKQGFPYISAEMEEGIYRDSNNLARRLNDKDIASQIRYIVSRFDDPDYVNRLRQTAELSGIRTYSSPDPFVLISSVMSSQNMWGREKTREYLIVRKAGREDLLDKIEDGGISVSAAYKEVVLAQNKKRKRTTNKLPSLVKMTDQITEESKKKKYSEKELETLKDCIARLSGILAEYQK